jgi:hypothetical protein
MQPCFECGRPAEHAHHVVPRVRGGTRTVQLCAVCHGKVHERDMGTPALTRAALALKRDRNERLGGTQLPYGKRLATDGIHLEDCQAEQDIIRMVRMLQSARLSSRRIAAYLAAQGHYSRVGKPFTPSAILAMHAREAP